MIKTALSVDELALLLVELTEGQYSGEIDEPLPSPEASIGMFTMKAQGEISRRIEGWKLRRRR